MYKMTIQADTLRELGERLILAGSGFASASEQPAGLTSPVRDTTGEPKAEEGKAEGAEAEEPKAEELDFQNDVAPSVLRTVSEAGKPAVAALLDEFGVERASQIDPARWPELLERLADLRG